MAQASSGKNITPVCTTFSVCISIKQSCRSPESKKCFEIDIQDQGGWVLYKLPADQNQQKAKHKHLPNIQELFHFEEKHKISKC